MPAAQDRSEAEGIEATACDRGSRWAGLCSAVWRWGVRLVALMALLLSAELGLRALDLDPYPYRGGRARSGPTVADAEAFRRASPDEIAALPEKRPGEIRVAVLSGGAVEPDGLRRIDGVPARIGRLLRRRRPKLDIRVLGIADYRFWLTEYAGVIPGFQERVHADVFLLLVDASSLVPVQPATLVPFLDLRDPWTAAGGESFLMGHIERALYLATGARWALEYYRKNFGGGDSVGFEPFEKGVGELVALQRETGVKLVVALFPPPLDLSTRPLAAAQARALEIGRAAGLNMVDLGPALEGEDVYAPRRTPMGMPYGALGHLRIARAILPHLLAVLPAGSGAAAVGGEDPSDASEIIRNRERRDRGGRRADREAVSGGARLGYGLGSLVLLSGLWILWRRGRRRRERSRSRPLSWLALGLKRVLLLLGTLSLGLGVAEVGLRVGGMRPPEPPRPLMTDGVDTMDLRVEKRRIDARRPGEIRISVLGDSMTFGFGVPGPAAFPARLQAILREKLPGREIQVFNLGKPGDDIEQEVARYPPWHARIQPDHVVLVAYINDVAAAETAFALGLVYHAGAEKGFLARHFWVIDHLRARLRMAIMQHVTTLHYRSTLGSGEQSEASLEPIAAALTRLRDLCRSTGAKLHLVVFPWLYDLDDYPVEAMHQEFSSIAERLGIGGFDLLPAFRGRRAEVLRVAPADEHPNARGHQIAAEALARYLLPLLK